MKFSKEERRELKQQNKKRCKKCKEVKAKNCFHPNRAICKICYRTGVSEWTKNNLSKRNQANKKWRIRSLEKTILSRTRCRAKKKQVEFNLELTDIIIPEKCPILGIPLFRCDGHGKDNSPSIDRIKNTQGYIKGNVHIISNRANTLKSSASIEEIEKLLNYLKSLDKN